jgi:Protein of unknown function (DUF1592)/Protein of unknown function (DUF1588)/Protein of unknown function (DUF1587)/Protein of unknown function (DUF1585)/Protein of unknown function (DUF1595)
MGNLPPLVPPYKWAHMRHFFLLMFAAGMLSAATPFDQAVQPILKQTCALCHSEKLTSGGLNITPFLDPGSIVSNRDGWERILAKLRTGEMPPKGVPRPPAEKLDALMKFVDGEFDRADRARKPDPGRVTARRMNRAEYANTIRDLLGVHFRANQAFPPDDSGFGFDNIGDVLTVSPVLLQQYLSAAEQIASRVVGADPLPKPGLFNKKDKVRRSDTDTIEVADYIDYDAEYIVRALITGHRGMQGKPVTLTMFIDGKPMKTVEVESAFTLVNRQGGATQRTSEEVRVLLPEGPHSFKAAFINDETLKTIAEKDRMNSSKNIYLESFEIAGPFPPEKGLAGKKDVLICDPASGTSCVERILTALVHRAYRRPVLKSEVAELMKVDERARAAGYNPGQSLQFAITAMLISPQFLFRIEHDPRSMGRISDVELASRLSYFLWSSMPDAELLRVAEAGKLQLPEVLDAQVKRMLADAKSSALAENFAGQWLELRSLDAQKPDPKKFPEWGAELKEAMRTETTMFFEAVLRENRPISDFINGKYSFLNERLAKYYGIPGVTGPEFRRVELSTEQRSGVFTQASVLTVSSYPARTSIVLRGKYILENVLGAPPPPPPPVPLLDEAAIGTSQSLRQQMESHRANAVCASCHSRMDPLGFALENYDAIGHWRTEDGKFPVDASGTFPNGKSFQTPDQMKALLAADLPEFTRCLTEKMLTYALGRGIESYDRLTVRDIARQTKDNEYRFQSIINGIVHSLPFQQRRGAGKQEIAQK